MKFNSKIFILTVIMFLMATSQFIFVGILDRIATSIDVSVATAGQLITIFSLSNAIGTPLVMMATAKLDLRKRLLLGMSIMLIGFIMTPTLPGFGFLALSRIITGIGSGFFTVTAFTMAPRLAAKGREVSAIADVALGGSAALVLGVPVGRILTSTFEWPVLFWGLGTILLFGILMVSRVIPVVEGTRLVPLSEQLSFLRQSKVIIALSITFLMFLNYSLVNTFTTPFLTSVVNISEESVSAVLLVLGISSVVGSKVTGMISDRFGAARTVVSVMIMQAIALVLLFVISESALMAIPLFMIWMTTAWMFAPPQNYLVSRLVPGVAAIMLSLNSSFTQFGFAAGAGVGGFVVENFSLSAIPVAGAIVVILGSSIAKFFYSRLAKEASSENEASLK